MASQLSLEAVVFDLVRRHPGSDKYRLCTLLRQAGYSVDLTSLNRILYRGHLPFEWRPGSGLQRLWYPASGESTAVVPTASMSLDADDLAFGDLIAGLYPWQHRALDAWRRRSYRGVVEAVTGAGKTRIALVAAAEHLVEGGHVAVVVPTVALADQWIGEFRQHLAPRFANELRIGRFDHRGVTLNSHDVIVATSSAGMSWHLLPAGFDGLLIADECHHYGSERWSAVLEEPFRKRLGLTATYDRDDSGLETYLDPFFGGVCYSTDYREALRDNVIAHFVVAFVGIPFTAEERIRYEDELAKARHYRKRLMDQYDVPSEPFGDFIRAVHRLRTEGTGPAAVTAGMYLTAFGRCREVLATAEGKLVRLRMLVSLIRSAERTIVFTQTKKAARDAAAILRAAGVQADVLESSMDIDERRIVFTDFERGDTELLAAPRLLDEGIDVPAADLAVVLASSRSKRQMIQRMGRVLRKKPDGRRARIIVLYVEGTTEDPTKGAHEDFISLLTSAADEVRTFGSGSTIDEVCRFLHARPSAAGAGPPVVIDPEQVARRVQEAIAHARKAIQGVEAGLTGDAAQTDQMGEVVIRPDNAQRRLFQILHSPRRCPMPGCEYHGPPGTCTLHDRD
jgi:superfamily II DNA or RNA helicase